jgi:hypothetical protein
MDPQMLQFGCHNASSIWQISVEDFGPLLNPNATSCGWYIDPGPLETLQLMSGYEIMEDGSGSIGEILATRLYPVQDITVTNTVISYHCPS